MSAVAGRPWGPSGHCKKGREEGERGRGKREEGVRGGDCLPLLLRIRLPAGSPKFKARSGEGGPPLSLVRFCRSGLSVSTRPLPQANFQLLGANGESRAMDLLPVSAISGCVTSGVLKAAFL